MSDLSTEVSHVVLELVIRNERFHRFLNKIEAINTAETGITKWRQGVLYALYAWNAGPIAGTDVSRAFAAKAREFPFPIELQDRPGNPEFVQADAALEHIETAFPLLYRQQEVLNILNEERLARHRELRNKTKTQRIFQPGDIVIS